MTRRGLVAAGAVASLLAAVAVVGAVATSCDDDATQCGARLMAVRGRCCATRDAPGGVCRESPAPSAHLVAIGASTLVIGPSDWEAEGRVAPRTLHTAPFAIDAYEATVEDVARAGVASLAAGGGGDHGRAASGLTRDEAARFCASRGMRLPTEDEWIAAAAGSSDPAGRRYPWGDTGAVCRRAAFGLARGPCSRGGLGPDTVGAHPDGQTPEGLFDMAGNVAEWVTAADGALGVARGGSWRSALAAELRVWSRLEIDPHAHDDRVGVRCARDLPVPDAAHDAGARTD